MWFRASLAALLLPTLALGQAKEGPGVWREEAKKRLKPAQLAVLARQKFVVGDKKYKQVCLTWAETCRSS
jgi:hypothetical protein